MNDRWTIIAEHFDKEKMEHYSLNWNVDNKYFAKLLGKSDGLTLNKETLLIVLQKVITNYNIVAILDLPNYHNTDQAEINKIKKSLQINSESRGYNETTHCEGEPSDIMLSNDCTKIYESFDLVQSLERKIAGLSDLKEKIEDKIKKLYEEEHKHKNKLRELENFNSKEQEYDDLTNKLNIVKERYRNGLKECNKIEEYCVKVKSDADEYVAKVKAEVDSMKRRIEKDVLKSKTAKYLNEHQITLEILKEMNYERELKIAINKNEEKSRLL